MRTWKPAPRMGTTISALSRKYFFSVAVAAMAVVGSYMWTGFPYDNLCVNDPSEAILRYQGTWDVYVHGSNTTDQTVTVEESFYSVRFCRQEYFRMKGVVAFPALPSFQPDGDEWMNPDQVKLTTIYGWTSVGVLVLVASIFLRNMIVSFLNLFRGTYKPSGRDMNVPFSDVPAVCAYIPQVRSMNFAYPLLACDVDGLDEELFEWSDDDRPYSYYDLTRDAEELLRGSPITKDGSKTVFTRIRHWPPEVVDPGSVRPV